MFLRASEQSVNLEAAISEDPLADAGVPHGAELRQFALTVLRGDAVEAKRIRTRIETVLGFPGLVDVAATVAMFDSINRVADATGTQLEEPYAEATALTTKRFEQKGFNTSDRIGHR